MNEELLKRLDVLATKLGVTAQYLWGVLVRQARVTLIEDVVFIALTVALTYISYRWWARIVTEKCPSETEGVAAVIVGIVNVVGICVSVACLLELPTLIANPEYFALTKLLEAVK